MQTGGMGNAAESVGALPKVVYELRETAGQINSWEDLL